MCALFLAVGLAWRAAREDLLFCATAETLDAPFLALVLTAAFPPEVFCAEATLLAVLPDFWVTALVFRDLAEAFVTLELLEARCALTDFPALSLAAATLLPLFWLLLASA